MCAAKRVLMIEPVAFHSNAETYEDNFFMERNPIHRKEEIQKLAHAEFLSFKKLLMCNGIEILSFQDIVDNNTPDSIFPNNWFSTHEDGMFILYPVRFESRRREKRSDIISELRKTYPNLVDLSHYEAKGKFLEGTGSLVFDRSNKIIYCALSQRSNDDVLKEVEMLLGYRAVRFTAVDFQGQAVYHTNVLLTVGFKWAVLALETVENELERRVLVESLVSTGHEIIEISKAQMTRFCGNMLELQNNLGEHLIVMSTQAYKGLLKKQIACLEKYGRIVHSDISTIERFGGGGARCMLAELF